MTRKEYEKKINELDAKLYDEDISKDEIDKLVQDIEKLHKQYPHYDKEILQEAIDILKGGTTYVPTKKRYRGKYPVKFIGEE